MSKSTKRTACCFLLLVLWLFFGFWEKSFYVQSQEYEPESEAQENESDQGEISDEVIDSKGEDEGSGQNEEETSSRTYEDPKHPPPKKVIMTGFRSFRLERAKKIQRQRLKEQRKKYGIGVRPDPRGKPELRICSVNMNNYGLVDDFKRAMRGSSPATLKMREQSIIEAIKVSRCDVVGIQGLLGRDYGLVLEALKRFARRLEKETLRQWQSVVAEDTNLRFSRHGFLVSGKGIEVIGGRSYTDQILPPFKDSKLAKFPRGPFEIRLRVTGKGDAGQKAVYVLSYLFHSKISARKRDPEQERMQMAEALRRLVQGIQKQFPRFYKPIFVVLGDRGTGRISPTAAILEGAWQLQDFQGRGLCSLEKDELFSCEEMPSRPRVLFDLIGGKLAKPPKLIKRKIGGEIVYFSRMPHPKVAAKEREVIDSRAPEIYMLHRDLRYARRDCAKELSYATGVAEVENFVKNSPLVWVELNW